MVSGGAVETTVPLPMFLVGHFFATSRTACLGCANEYIDELESTAAIAWGGDGGGMVERRAVEAALPAALISVVGHFFATSRTACLGCANEYIDELESTVAIACGGVGGCAALGWENAKVDELESTAANASGGVPKGDIEVDGVDSTALSAPVFFLVGHFLATARVACLG